MRTVTVQYELWQTEERNDNDEVTRKEERIGEMREKFIDCDNLGTGVICEAPWRDEFLQDHLEEFAKHLPPLKLTDVEVRARPFP